VGILKAHEAKRLSKVAENRPSEAELVYNHAIALREILFRIFSSVANGGSAGKADLAALNQNLSKTMARSRIVKSLDGFTWDLDLDKNALDWLLQPIVRSAADLLVSDELKRVKRCAAEDCGWLFLDVSRNQSRRWCNMKDCGNRAKAGRFYKKKKEALGTP
jgi:predicted RNA-binding Zn ribbon-like protein